MRPLSPGSTTTAAAATTVVLVLLLVHLTSAAGPPSAKPSPPSLCSDELVKFSLCLPYISSSPNNLTDIPSSECCDECASAFSAGNGDCLCYLIRQPLLFGFPINSSRLLSLTSLCPIQNKATKTSFSLASLCSGSPPALPPLHSITGPRRPRPRPPPHPPSSGHNDLSPPSTSPPDEEGPGDFAPEPAKDSPSHPGSPFTPPTSSATMKINKTHGRLPPGIILIYLLVHIIERLLPGMMLIYLLFHIIEEP